MSGFDRASESYGLTRTKAAYWHRARGARKECSCKNAGDIVDTHVVGSGFDAECLGNWWRVTGPGISDGWTADLYVAISGHAGSENRDPERRWKF